METQWLYRGEGNCSLVVADSAKRKVYRLLKQNYTTKFVTLTDPCNTESKARAIYADHQQVVSYIRWVMQPLLSSSYVVLPKLISIEEQFVTNLVKYVSSQRPARRLQKAGDMVDLESRSALMLPDFCFLPSTEGSVSSHRQPSTISIEIKPKKAFISSDVDIDSEQPGVCKFCMHQHLKCQSGQWPETSNYCPLDLFSGSRDRMKHALQSLITTPQNNFKLWKDGEDVYSAEIQEDLEDILHNWFDNPSLQKNRAVPTLLDMVIEILLMSVSPGDLQPHSHLTRSPTLQLCQSSTFTFTENGRRACRWLPQGCVLERVAAAQLLDDLDIVGIYPLYLQLMRHLSLNPWLRTDWGFDGHFTADWLMDSTAFRALEVDSLQWVVQKVKRFLVSKTLQDCSIMVAVVPLTNREVQQCSTTGNQGNNMLQFCGRWYKVSVALVDLDPKPLDKIPIYFRQASAIRASFQDTGDTLDTHDTPGTQDHASLVSNTSDTSTTTLKPCLDGKVTRTQGQTEIL